VVDEKHMKDCSLKTYREEKSLWRIQRRWQGIIKVDLKVRDCEDAYCINLAKNSDQYRRCWLRYWSLRFHERLLRSGNSIRTRETVKRSFFLMDLETILLLNVSKKNNNLTNNNIILIQYSLFRLFYTVDIALEV
jgi:hypothetical protein